MKTLNNNIEYLKNVKELLITIDMVNGFVKEGKLAASSIQRILPRIIELNKEALEKRDTGIVFVRDSHKPSSVELLRYPEHCLENTAESMLHESLRPFEKDALTYLKNSTNLVYVMQKDLLKLPKLERVRLTGCLSEVCVMDGAIGLRTFFDEVNMPVEVCVHSDAIDTFDAIGHRANEVTENALNLMEQKGIKILRKTM